MTLLKDDLAFNSIIITLDKCHCIDERIIGLNLFKVCYSWHGIEWLIKAMASSLQSFQMFSTEMFSIFQMFLYSQFQIFFNVSPKIVFNCKLAILPHTHWHMALQCIC